MRASATNYFGRFECLELVCTDQLGESGTQFSIAFRGEGGKLLTTEEKT